MSNASYIATTVAAASMAFAQSAYSAERIDNPRVAANVADYITNNCPVTEAEANPEATRLCIAAGADMSFSIATEMGTYIAEVSAATSPFWAGTAKGDLMANCFGPMNALSEGDFSNLTNYLDAAFNAVKSCEGSMVRAGDAVDIDYQPTARNTVSCHMNRLRGYDCE